MRYQRKLNHPKSSGWHNASVISHPDEIPSGANSSEWLRVQMTLCRPDAIGQCRESSWWHPAVSISHPGEILGIAKSSEWRYGDVIMGAMTSQFTSLTIVYSTVYLGTDQRKHQSSASLAFVRGIHRWPVNSPQKRPITHKMFPFDDAFPNPHVN